MLVLGWQAALYVRFGQIRPSRTGTIALNLAGIVLATVASVHEKTDSYTSYCGQCGKFRFTRDRRLPFVDRTFWRTDVEEDTLVSAAILNRGIVGRHDHQWVLAHTRR